MPAAHRFWRCSRRCAAYRGGRGPPADLLEGLLEFIQEIFSGGCVRYDVDATFLVESRHGVCSGNCDSSRHQMSLEEIRY